MTPVSELPELSVIAPCRDEAEGLEAFHARVRAAVGALGVVAEMVYVDDGSVDATWAVIVRLASADPAVRGVRLSRNFGQQAALTAGMEVSRGRRVLLADADGQDPPEVLERLWRRMDEGFDVVHARRSGRPGDGWAKRGTAWLFYRVAAWAMDPAPPADTGDFRLLSRRAVDAVLSLPERVRFLRGLWPWVGFPQASVDYVREPRVTGRTRYGAGSLVRLALDALTSGSAAPVRLVWVVAAVLAAAAAVLAAGSVVAAWRGAGPGAWVPLALAAWVGVVGAAAVAACAVVGEYAARALLEAKARPLYLVSERVGGGFPSGRAGM